MSSTFCSATAGVLGITDPAKAEFLHSLSFTEGGMLQTVFVIAFMLLAPAFGVFWAL